LEDKKIEAELLQIIGLKRLDKLSKEEASTILKLIGEQRLKEAHIQALVRLAPGFIAVATEALRVQMKVIAAAKEVQQDVVQTISAAVEGISQALKILVGSAESDATREKLAAVLLEAGSCRPQRAARVASCVTTTKAVPWSRASVQHQVEHAVGSAAVQVAGGLIGQHAGRPRHQARAMATRWRSPPDSSAGRWCMRSCRPTAASMRCAVRSAACSRGWRRIHSGMATLSSALNSGSRW
jgi:hypothetical protein